MENCRDPVNARSADVALRSRHAGSARGRGARKVETFFAGVFAGEGITLEAGRSHILFLERVGELCAFPERSGVRRSRGAQFSGRLVVHTKLDASSLLPEPVHTA